MSKRVEFDFVLEKERISYVKNIMNTMGTGFDGISEYLRDDLSLYNWFFARKRSLAIGSLGEDVLQLYQSEHFDFGLKVLFWDDWFNMLKKYISENGLIVGSEAKIDKVYYIGKWIRRQYREFDKLSEEQKELIAGTGLEAQAISHYLWEKKQKSQMELQQQKKDEESEPQSPQLEVVPRCVTKVNGTHYTTDVTPLMIDSLMKNIDMEATLDNLRKAREEEKRIEENERIAHENEVYSLVRKKLCKSNPSVLVEEFIELAKFSYLESIASKTSFQHIANFEKVNLKKFINSKNTDWRVEQEPEKKEDGGTNLSFYSFGIKKEWNIIKIIKVLFEISYYDDDRLSGGFYSEDEEYVSLSNVELGNIINECNSAAFDNLQKVKNESLFAQSRDRLINLFHDLDKRGWNRSEKKEEMALRAIINEKIFTWETIDSDILPDGVIDDAYCIKILKCKSNSVIEFPECYLIVTISDHGFLPSVYARLQIYYNNVCYSFSNGWRDSFSYSGRKPYLSVLKKEK